jgi:hypothetical protein
LNFGCNLIGRRVKKKISNIPANGAEFRKHSYRVNYFHMSMCARFNERIVTEKENLKPKIQKK